MAFAYSQLGDISNAGEAFLHAFQAAKDSGNAKRLARIYTVNHALILLYICKG